MNILQLFSLPFYLLAAIIVFFISNSKLLVQNKFFSNLLNSLLVLSIAGLVTNVFGPQLLGLQTSNLIIPAVTTIFLLSLGFFLVKSKIFSPGFIFYQIVASASLILILVIAFTFLITLTDLALASFGKFREILIVVNFAIIAVLVFQPVRAFLEQILGKILFPNQLNFKKLSSEINILLTQNLKLSNLAHNLLEKFIEFAKLTGAGIVLFENGKPSFTNFINLPRPKTGLLSQFGKLTKPVNSTDENYSHVIPLIFKMENSGVLILGKKLAGNFFANELKQLEKNVDKITPPLLSAQAFAKIDRFNLKLKEIVEKSTHDLAVANQKLSQIDAIKDEFVSLTSHELRTPMTAIKSYLWMILSGKAGKISSKLGRYLDLAYTSTERMIKLVNDLLNVSKIESGRTEFDPQGVNIVELTKSVVADVEAEAAKRGLVIFLKPKDLPLVFADWGRIYEVLTNLVGNSLKFTPVGGKIKIEFKQVGDLIETAVTDTGKGIAEADMPRLFHKFGLKPGSFTATRETGGSGLGLYICKSLIDLHKGKIWAKSKLGVGSTFTFSLPCATEEQLAKHGIYDPEAKVREVAGKLPGTAMPA